MRVYFSRKKEDREAPLEFHRWGIGVGRFDGILFICYNRTVQKISDTEAKSSLAGPVDAVTCDGAGVVEGGAAMEETQHLLSSPTNAERIRQGLSDFEAGSFQAGDLCD